MSKINKELLKGASDVMILKVVSDEPLYGYEIAKRLRTLSSDVLTLGEGTLYPILHKLEQHGLLESFWQEVGGRNRKYYQLSPKGRKLLAAKTAEWQTFRQAMTSIIG